MSSDWLKGDAALFLRDFGEDVVVVDRAGATPRTVRAIVDRLPPTIGPGGGKLGSQIILEMANDPVAGIDVATVNLGKAIVRIGERLGGMVEDRLLAMSEDADGWHDPGMVRLKAI